MRPARRGIHATSAPRAPRRLPVRPALTARPPGVFSRSSGAGVSRQNARIFQTSVLHNLVHGIFGVAGLLLSRTWEGSCNFLIGGGAIYLVLWVLRLVGVLVWLPRDDSDHLLHFALGAGVILLGVLRGRRPDTMPATTAR
jgi:hypothetical protein